MTPETFTTILRRNRMGTTSRRIRRRQAVNLNSGFLRAAGWPKTFDREMRIRLTKILGLALVGFAILMARKQSNVRIDPSNHGTDSHGAGYHNGFPSIRGADVSSGLPRHARRARSQQLRRDARERAILRSVILACTGSETTRIGSGPDGEIRRWREIFEEEEAIAPFPEDASFTTIEQAEAPNRR